MLDLTPILNSGLSGIVVTLIFLSLTLRFVFGSGNFFFFD